MFFVIVIIVVVVVVDDDDDDDDVYVVVLNVPLLTSSFPARLTEASKVHGAAVLPAALKGGYAFCRLFVR